MKQSSSPSHSKELTSPSTGDTLQTTPEVDVVQVCEQVSSHDKLSSLQRRLQQANEENFLPSPQNVDAEGHGRKRRYSFAGRLRSLVSLVRRGDSKDSVMEFVRPDSRMGPEYMEPFDEDQYNYPTVTNQGPAPNSSSSTRSYEIPRRPYPPKTHVRIFNRIISRMSTIESCDTGEGTGNTSSGHPSVCAGSTSSSCGDSSSGSSSYGEALDTSHYSTTRTGTLDDDVRGEPLDRPDSLISCVHESISGMGEIREVGGRTDRWDDGASGSSGSRSVTLSYSADGSPCESMNVSLGHSGPSMEEEEEEGLAPS
jgi:hypothetical protein